MSTRRIHTIERMIAIHHVGNVFAVFPSSFSKLVDKLLPDLDRFERISFKSAVTPVSLFVQREHIKNIPKWELIFLNRLGDQMAEVNHLLACTLDNTDEIEKFLPDILEGYRGNHIGEFAFFFDKVEGTGASVVTLQDYDPPSVLQRLTKSERESRQRVVLPLAAVSRVEGTSLELEITVNSRILRLNRNGWINWRDGG